jgi:hypothetical protein
MTASPRTDRLIGAAIACAIAAAVVSLLPAPVQSAGWPVVLLAFFAVAVYGISIAIRASAARAWSSDAAVRMRNLFSQVVGWLSESRGHPVDPNAPRPIRYYRTKAATWRTLFSDETAERRENPVGLLRPRRGEPDDEELCRFANGVARVALTDVISHGLETDVRAITKAPPPPEREVKRDPRTGAETVRYVPVPRYPKAQTAACVIRAAVTIPDSFHAVIFGFEGAAVSNELWKRLHDRRNWIESLASELPGMTAGQLDDWLTVDDERISDDPVLGRIPGLAITLAHGAARDPEPPGLDEGEPADDPSDPFFSSPFGRGRP